MLGAKAKITVTVGLLFAILFLALGFRELQRPHRAVIAPTAPVPVPLAASLAVAGRAIATGETITADVVRNGSGDPLSNPMTATPAEAIGKVAIKPIAAGSQILRSAIGAERKLAIRVPIGMRAISIDTTAEIAVAGLVRPGDRVDVQVVYPGADAINGARGAGQSRAKTLLQMVQVLAVGEVVVGTAAVDNNNSGSGDLSGLSAAPQPARTVTLALSPEQVSILSLAKSTGALYLSLRNPTDQDIIGPVASATAPRALSSTAKTAPRRVRHQPAHAIELVVGGQRQVIYAPGSAAQ